ncbi:YgaP-like transmembrane domain [Pseudomonas sp. WHRI 8822A]|uniref:YgaP-like transmembrane domain n=1 Tax=Pseudomonas sp. WHRI 8822A TaxID=3162568 RepID=UPI0032EEEF85
MSTFDKQGGSNVQGWERALSIGSGIAMARGGLKRGGILGLARAAFGGMLVARGLSGHCRLKSIMEDARSMRPDVDRISDTVSRIEGEIAERVKPVVNKVSDGV